MSLADLPEDVVLLILEHCTLESISALSTVNRSFYSISRTCPITLLRNVAYNTFHERAPRVLCNDPEDYGSYSCASLIRHYRYQYLAAVLVDRTTHLDSRYAVVVNGVRASDPRGDELRNRLSKAWSVLDWVGKLMLEYQDVFSDRVDARTRLESVIKSKATRLDLRRDAGANWWTRRLAGRISVEEAQDFMLLWRCLCSSILLLHPISPGVELDALTGMNTSYYFDWQEHRVGRGSWVDWAVLAGGSQLFYAHWFQHGRVGFVDIPWAGMALSGPNGFIRDHLASLWRRRAPQQIARERAVAASLVRSLRLRVSDIDYDRSVLASHLEIFEMFYQTAGNSSYHDNMLAVPFFVAVPNRNPQVHAHMLAAW